MEEAPNGVLILQDLVSRIYPTDESENQPPGASEQPLYDVMQEGLNVHFQGLAFRERNAGRQIDEHMTDRGFNNQIGVHPETGKCGASGFISFNLNRAASLIKSKHTS